MQDLSKLIITSDYDTLKSEGIITATVTKPSGATLAANSRGLWSTDVVVGNTPIDNTYFRYTGDDGTWRLLAIQQATINATGPSGAYTLLVTASYIDRTTIRYTVEAMNPTNATFNTGAAITVSFRSAMYSDPFA